MAASMRTHVRQKRRHAMHHAHQVYVDNPTPGVERDVVDAAAAGDTGVITEYVDLAESRDRLLGSLVDGSGFGHVTDDAVDLRADPRQVDYRLMQRIFLDVGQHDVAARLSE